MENNNSDDNSNTPSESILLRIPNPSYSSPHQFQDGTDLKRGLNKVPTTNTMVTPHQTLGQIAEKIQEEARAAARSRGEDFDTEDLYNQQEEDFDEDDQDNGEDEDDQGQQGSESTGRWTRQEHELFLEGLKRFGKVRKTTFF